MRAGDGTRTIYRLGFDAQAIALAVARSGGEVRSLGTIRNRAASVARLVNKLGKPEQLRACYEAGPTGCSHTLPQTCIRALGTSRLPQLTRGGLESSPSAVISATI